MTGKDLGKRHPERRLMVLKALTKADETPLAMAERWGIHPTSTFRILEKLRKNYCVERTGSGLGAVYKITKKGWDRLEWLK